MNDNLLYRLKRTVYKWWCIVYKPAFQLFHHGFWPQEKEPYAKYPETKASVSDSEAADTATSELAHTIIDSNRQSQHNIDDLIHAAQTQPEDTVGDAYEIPENIDADVLSRANEILARLNREAAEDEAKKQKQIEEARKQAAEHDRLTAILKSTERNIDAYIQEGLSKQHHPDDNQ